MSDLTKFLEARYDEAETHARDVHERRCGTSPELVTDPLDRPMPVECECDWPIVGVLADLAAKRAIVQEYDHSYRTSHEPGLYTAVRLLAQPFSQHADFDPGWKL
jgi:hypothetical protein